MARPRDCRLENHLPTSYVGLLVSVHAAARLFFRLASLVKAAHEERDWMIGDTALYLWLDSGIVQDYMYGMC